MNLPASDQASSRQEPKSPLRVLFLSHFFQKGGRQHPVWALRHISSLSRQPGVDVRVVSYTPAIPRWLGRLGIKPEVALCPRRDVVEGLHVDCPRWFYGSGANHSLAFNRPAIPVSIALASARRSLTRIVQEFRPDVTYAYLAIPNGEMARWIKRRFGVPYVVTEHSMEHFELLRGLPKRRVFLEPIVEEAFAWHAVGLPMAGAMERAFPGRRIERIENGADPIHPDLFETTRPPELVGKRVLLSAGYFNNVKNFPLLVRAFRRVADKHPDAILRILGDGDNFELAKRESTGMGDRVQLPGSVPHRRVLQEMVWAYAFVSCSTYESFSTVVSEASSAGLPLIWTRGTGHDAILSPGVHGLSIASPVDEDELARAIDRLLSNPTKAREMGDHAREYFQANLTWDRSAARLVSVLREAAGTGTLPAPAGP